MLINFNLLLINLSLLLINLSLLLINLSANLVSALSHLQMYDLTHVHRALNCMNLQMVESRILLLLCRRQLDLTALDVNAGITGMRALP